MPTLIENLHKIIDEAHTRDGNEKGLLVINSGCHDLAFNNSAIYIARFKQVLTILKEIKEKGLYHIIYQNITPWPHGMEQNRDRHLNTFVNAATTRWVSQQLDDLGIPVVDIFTLALPFEDMSECAIHFICHGDIHKEHKGAAGREATQQIMRYACDN